MKKYNFIFSLFTAAFLFSCNKNINEEISQDGDYSYIVNDPVYKSFANQRSIQHLTSIQINFSDYQNMLSTCMQNGKDNYTLSNCLSHKDSIYGDYFNASNQAKELLLQILKKYPEYKSMDAETKYKLMQDAGAYNPAISLQTFRNKY